MEGMLGASLRKETNSDWAESLRAGLLWVVVVVIPT